MDYEVTREANQYHVQERGQLSRGTTLTDVWLKQMGFWPLSRLNIDAAINATMAAHGGQILDPHAARRMPKEISFTPGFKNFPSQGRGTLPRNPKPRMRIPENLMIRG